MNRHCYHRLIDRICLLVSSRLYTQTLKRFKISEERVRDHIHTLGLFQQPGVEALREPGDDPYDFKEGDIEYTFSTSKRLKGQGREPSKKAKVGQHTQFKKCKTVEVAVIKIPVLIWATRFSYDKSYVNGLTANDHMHFLSDLQF